MNVYAAERAVLSWALAGESGSPEWDAVMQLQVGDFRSEHHQDVWAAVVNVARRGGAVDCVTVLDSLSRYVADGPQLTTADQLLALAELGATASDAMEAMSVMRRGVA